MAGMAKQHFYMRLLPPRTTFPADITPEEMALMQQHATYFLKAFDEGRVLLYGPVMGHGGAFGMGVLEVESEAEAREFAENDPSVRGGLNRFELAPMRVAAARGPG